MSSFGGLLRGFKLGVGLAAQIEETAGRRAVRQNTYPSEDPNRTEKSPLDPTGSGVVSGGTKITSPGTKIDTVKTSSTEDKEKGTITGSGSRDTLVGSAGKDEVKSGGRGGFIQNVYNYYRSQGLSHPAAAGFAGNFMQELGGAQDVIEGRRKGDRGASGYVGQWQGVRQRNLLKFAGERGHSSPTLKDQLDFALEEGKADSPYRDDVWAKNAGRLSNAKSTEEATAVIRKYFERPSANDLGARTKYALMASGEAGAFQDTGGGGGGGGGIAGDTLEPEREPGDELVARRGAIPELEEEGGDTELASARLSIEAPEIDLGAPQQAFEILMPGDEWAQQETLFAQGGGAIPDFTGDSLLGLDDDAGKKPGFGWGSILQSGQPQGGTSADVGLGGEGDFGAPGGFANASYGAGAAPMTGWFDRDTADAQAAQAGRLTRQRLSAQQAAGQRNVLLNQQHAANAEAARQKALADAQAKAVADKAKADAAAKAKAIAIAKAKAAAIAKAKADAIAKAKAAAAKKAGTTPVSEVQPTSTPAPTVPGTSPVPYTAAPGPQFSTPPNESKLLAAINTGPLSMKRAAQQVYGWMQAGKLTPEQEAYAAKHGFTDKVQNYQQGGAIPDPDESSMVAGFAKGGSTDSLFSRYFTKRKSTAKNRDERFQELLREEGRGPRSSRDGIENARDRAARRLSKEEGRPSSTAYRPGGGGKKAAPGERAPAKRREGTVEPDRIETGATLPDISRNPYEVEKASPQRPQDLMWQGRTDTGPSPQRPQDLMWQGDTGAGTTPQPGLELGEVPENVGAGPTVPAIPDEELPGLSRPEYEGVRPIKRTRTGQPTVDVERVLEETFGPQEPQPRPAPAPEPEPGPFVPVNRGGGDIDAVPAVAPPPAPEQPAAIPPVAATGVTQPSVVPPVAASGITTPIEQEALTPKQANLVVSARHHLELGGNPDKIANMLRIAKIPMEFWPAKLREPSFANGGAIPDPEFSIAFERGGSVEAEEGIGGSLFAGVDNEAAAEGRIEPLAPTPKLRNDVAIAAHDGVQFLKRTFGLGGAGDGAVPTPEDGAIRAQGAKRMADGEGAADDEEIANIDAQIDPRGELAGGDKEMLRLAAVHSWYLEHGQKDKAEAVAASLMQYGAQRVARIGGLAAGAYSKYQQTGDPKDLDAVAGLMEKAYDMIPNGANVDISVGENGALLSSRTNADGDTEQYEIQPDEITGLLTSAMNGSGYWKEIAKLADPAGYESQLTEGRQVREGERDRRRTLELKYLERGWNKEDAAAAAEAELAKEEREYKRKQEETKATQVESDRQAERDRKIREKEILTKEALERAAKAGEPVEPKADQDAIEAALPAASAAQKAFEEDDSEENKAVRDAAVARLYRAYGYDAAKVEAAIGVGLSEVNLGTEQPPTPNAKRMFSKKQGKEIWAEPDPSAPSGWKEVAVEAAP